MRLHDLGWFSGADFIAKYLQGVKGVGYVDGGGEGRTDAGGIPSFTLLSTPFTYPCVLRGACPTAACAFLSSEPRVAEWCESNAQCVVI